MSASFRSLLLFQQQSEVVFHQPVAEISRHFWRLIEWNEALAHRIELLASPSFRGRTERGQLLLDASHAGEVRGRNSFQTKAQFV